LFPKWECGFPLWEGCNNVVRVIARPILIQFVKRHKDAEQSIRAWYHEVKKAEWESSNEIKALYGAASVLKNGRVVFNICGNKYRLIVAMKYKPKIVYIRFIGTHQDYDLIDAETI
jgi:mRNA interferase HigB